MKKILSSLFAVVLFIGCTTSHPKTPVSVPVVARPASVSSAPAVAQAAPVTNVAVPLAQVPVLSSPQDLAALHQAYQTPARAADVVKVPDAPKAKESSVSLPAVSTVTAPKSHKLIFWLFTTVLAVPLAWATKKYGLPYLKEFLAFVKSKNVVADLKNLATKAESEIVVDFKTVEADAKSVVGKIESEFSKTPAVIAPAAPVVVPHVPVTPTPATK